LNIVNSLTFEVVYLARGAGQLELKNREVAFCPIQLQRHGNKGILFRDSNAPQ